MKIRLPIVFALVFSLFPISGCKPDSASLMTAVKADNTQDALRLIGKGADSNSRTSPSGWSALHYAARNGNVEVVQQLLSAGADPNYLGSMDGKANSSAASKPLGLARVSLEVVSEIPAAQMEETLHQNGLDDPALLKSMKDPMAADRYLKVVAMLTKVTK
ncbi:MAG: ankyrin repeat domain-containing protein [Terracidiphilus sp.]